MSRFVTGPQEEDLIQKIRTSLQEYFSLYASLRQSGVTGSILYEQVTDAYDQTQSSIQDLIHLNTEQTREIERQFEAQNHLNTYLMFSTLIFLAFVIVALLLGFRSLLYRPILKVQKQIDSFEIGQAMNQNEVRGATEIEDIFQSFVQLSNRLSRQKDQQLTFLSSIAHDLKNPLGAIKMSAEILSDEPGLAENHSEILAIISRQSDHLRRLVEDLLDTTRIESGHLDLKLSRCDIRQIITDTVLLHRNLSDRHSFESSLPSSPVYVLADEQRITQVMNNLLSNAVKYSPAGGRIKVELKTDSKFGLISIEDQGIGISEKDLETIFEPFHRTASTKATIPGVGLGLSVSKKIIQGHQGDISVESEPGRGSKFTVRLRLFAELEAGASAGV